MSKLLSPLLITGLILTLACIATAANPPGDSTDDWPSYGHDPGGMRYSPLTQINRENVAKLKIAWIFHTGDISDGKGQRKRSGFETTPLVVDGTLYLTTPFNRVIALDPATGAPCADFGKAGEVSLRDVPGFRPGWYHMTSAPAVIEDIVVVGSAIDDNGRVDMPAGVVRAFDARSGALRWSWDPIPPNSSGNPGKPWKSGAANAWTVMAVDPERDLVFVPTGSASPDYYGGLRPGDDKWADSVVALRAKTGEIAWGFQLVHHNLWDYDTASPPLLATLPHNGQKIPV